MEIASLYVVAFVSLALGFFTGRCHAYNQMGEALRMFREEETNA